MSYFWKITIYWVYIKFGALYIMVTRNPQKNLNSSSSGKVRIEKELLANLPKMYREVAQYLIDNCEWELVDAKGSA